MPDMAIDIFTGPGEHRPPLIQAYRRWLGVCRQCGNQVVPGEYVTWIPQAPITETKTHRMAVVHAGCVPMPLRTYGRSCNEREYVWLRTLAGKRE